MEDANGNCCKRKRKYRKNRDSLFLSLCEEKHKYIHKAYPGLVVDIGWCHNMLINNVMAAVWRASRLFCFALFTRGAAARGRPASRQDQLMPRLAPPRGGSNYVSLKPSTWCQKWGGRSGILATGEETNIKAGKAILTSVKCEKRRGLKVLVTIFFFPSPD